MSFTNQQAKQTLKTTTRESGASAEKLENIISNAIQKIGGNKENDLCKYLPVSTGGYMHHFTLRKMKTEEPEKLSDMIERFILQVDNPDRVTPKPRAARGSRKRRDQITLTRGDLERMLSIARLAGDKEMITKLTPKKSLSQIRKELLSSIRHNRADQELWNAYVEALNSQTAQQTVAGLNNTMLNNAGLTEAATTATNVTPGFAAQ